MYNSKKFDLNCKKFDKKYLKDIQDGILNFYNQKYKGIKIVYKISKSKYTFFIYAQLEVIEGSEWTSETVLLKSYDNIKAIEMFAQIPMSEYIDEYDDSKKNYLQKFIEEMEAVVIMYTTLGLNLEISHIENWKRYRVKYTITKGMVGRFYVNMMYSFDDMMTRQEYIKNINKLKRELSKNYEVFNKG